VNKGGYVYILASRKNGVLYTGVTADLITRTYQHKNSYAPGFSSKYNVRKLVYFEFHSDIRFAIRREKQIKRWKRAWKIEAIERENPNWLDLYNTIIP
jgi:putative endonuclease